MNNLGFENDIFFSTRSNHRWMIFAGCIMFLVWSGFDFYTKEALAPLYFVLRFIPVLIAMMFASPLNEVFFRKNHDKISVVIIGTIMTMNMLFILKSSNDVFISSVLLQGLLMIASAMLIRTNWKNMTFMMAVPMALPYVLNIKDPIVTKYLIEFNIFIGALTTIVIVFNHNLTRLLDIFFDTRASFEETREKLEKSNEDNNQLIRILCHDLGNALTIIEMSTTLLSENLEVPSEHRTFFDKNIARLKRASHNQKEIIEHVKQKEAISSGKMTIELVPVSLNIIFEKVKFIFDKKLKEKNLSLNINHRGRENPYVLAEMVSLSNNVINNIMSNAIKFSPDNSEIIVSIWQDKNEIYVTIEDFGIGMPEEILKNIFSSTAKTSRPGVRGEKGTGFGMPLAKTYMEQYQGDIFVESKENRGTRFTLKFKSITADTNSLISDDFPIAS